MVDLARLERATSTFAESRSDSTELQVQSWRKGQDKCFSYSATPAHELQISNLAVQDFKSEIQLC